MIVQERDRHLLRELAIMRVITREQAMRAAGFHSTTRANTRLLKLTRAGLLRRFFMGSEGVGRKALYALTLRGAHLVDVPLRGPQRRNDTTVVADFWVEHQLTVNEIYCLMKYGLPLDSPATFREWRAFFEPAYTGSRLIPDGYVVLATPTGTLSAFLEVDLGHERAKVWQEKVKNYVAFALSGAFEREFHEAVFQVLVVATTERKLHGIRKAVSAVTDRVFWFATLESAVRDFFGPVWWHVTEETQTSLLSEP